MPDYFQDSAPCGPDYTKKPPSCKAVEESLSIKMPSEGLSDGIFYRFFFNEPLKPKIINFPLYFQYAVCPMFLNKNILIQHFCNIRHVGAVVNIE
ncbi:hypothetical protein DDG13_11505 [Neisseria gonorrhoeae]